MDPRLETTYEKEIAALTAAQVPWACGFYLLAISSSGIAEFFYRPHFLGIWVQFYCAEAVLILLPLLFRKRLVEKDRFETVVLISWILVTALIHLYSTVAPLSSMAIGYAAVCIMTGACLLTSWSTRSQTALVAATLLVYSATVLAEGSSGLETVLTLVGVVAAGVISIQGTLYMDLHRRAIFREASRSELEASITRTLEKISKELNRGLGDDSVIDRIASLTRAATKAEWVLVLQPGENLDTMRVISGAGDLPSSLDNLKALDLQADDFPFLANHVEDSVTIVKDWRPPFREASRRNSLPPVLAAPLHHRGQKIGFILAGTTATSSRSKRLIGGIAQHAAIAIANSELVDELRRASSMKSEFLATMSHELRTPLHVIMGYTEMLTDILGPGAGDQVNQILQRLSQSETTLTDLIEATLDAHRLEAGRTGVRLRKFEDTALFHQVRTDTRWLPRTPGVDIRWNLPETPTEIFSDPDKLKIIAKNLIGNALKFTKRGAVSVGASIDRDRRRLKISVSDTGPGIPEEEIPRIFDMFQQASPSASEASLCGVGLGLFIVREFVKQLTGTLNVGNVSGGGTRFDVEVPLDITPGLASTNRLVA